MKLSTLIDTIDRSRDQETDVTDIAQAFGLSVDYCAAHNFVTCPYAQWYDTDGRVGHALLFLDNEAVAIINERSAKSGKSYDWIGNGRSKAFQHCCSLLADAMGETDIPTPPDTEMGAGFGVRYSSQILESRVIYLPTQETCTVTGKPGWGSLDFKELAQVTLAFPDGSSRKVAVKDVMIPFYTKSA